MVTRRSSCETARSSRHALGLASQFDRVASEKHSRSPSTGLRTSGGDSTRLTFSVHAEVLEAFLTFLSNAQRILSSAYQNRQTKESLIELYCNLSGMRKKHGLASALIGSWALAGAEMSRKIFGEKFERAFNRRAGHRDQVTEAFPSVKGEDFSELLQDRLASLTLLNFLQ
jgi:hypothetical protein